MNASIVVAAIVVAVVAAVRSTWSPCGLSMLSSITPIGERGRGYRFSSTAAWFVIGAVAGGATLGAAMLALATGVAAIGSSVGDRVGAAAVAAFLTAAIDLGVTGIRIPVLRRQVNEIWLDQFRSWVYGAGFGWQIGVGFSTYVMTAAVILIVALGALTADPWIAFAVGVMFGTLRGLSVLLGIGVTSPTRLQEVHRRLDRLRRPVWVTVVAVQLLAALWLGGQVWWPPVALEVVAVAAIAAAAYGVFVTRRSSLVSGSLTGARSGAVSRSGPVSRSETTPAAVPAASAPSAN